MFDVDGATADWLDDLRQGRSLPGPDIEALRVRLRSEMKQLTDHGLSGREAFYVGRSRVVPGYPLPEEYARAGAREVRRDRFRWIGAGILAYLLFNGLVWLLSLAGTTLVASTDAEYNWLLLSAASLQVLLSGGALLIMVYILPNMSRLGIADAYASIRRSRMGSFVLYVILAGSAVVLALISPLGWSSDYLLRRLGLEPHTEALLNAYSETMAAHEMIFSLVLAVALVTILFALGGRRKPGPRVGGER